MRSLPIIAIVLVFAVLASWYGSYLAIDGCQSGILVPALAAAATVAPPAAVNAEALRFDFTEGHAHWSGIDVPDAWPVVCGVPFPRGMLWDAGGLRLVTESGAELPLQTEATARWSREGSIQWLRVDTLAPAGERLYVEPGRSEAQPLVTLTVHRRDDGRVELDSGAARYVIAAGRFPIESIAIGGQPLARLGAARGLYVIDQHGREACAAEQGANIRVEAAGPVAACVRIEGDYVTADGEALARHITRVEVFAGQPFAHVTHTLVVARDTNEIWFREAGWELEAAVGQNTRAVFNVARDDPTATVTTELADGEAAYMLQREHRRFGAGEDRFEVVAGGQTLAEGAECGDWALLGGSRGALLMGCAESARQHPKEFEVSADRMILRLFSPRAGEELDFRGPTLAENWNLSGDLAEKAAQASPSAAGWSKTHDLLIAPLPAPDAERQAARLAALRREPVYALADPQWTFESDAMGPLHPRDPERYPGVEALIDRIFAQVQPRGYETGHYGFMDYFAGPTYGGGSGPCRAGRYRFAYGLRNSIWLAYARSGRRDIRAFAEGANRAYLDNYLTHSELLLTKDRAYGSSPYKTREAVRFVG